MLDLNIDNVVKDINELDQILVDTSDSEVLLKRKEVSAKFWKDIRLKESFLHQKSRARWAIEELSPFSEQ